MEVEFLWNNLDKKMHDLDSWLPLDGGSVDGYSGDDLDGRFDVKDWDHDGLVTGGEGI